MASETLFKIYYLGSILELGSESSGLANRMNRMGKDLAHPETKKGCCQDAGCSARSSSPVQGRHREGSLQSP